MLWVFLTAGLAGMLCGALFRAPALVLLSFLSFSITALLQYLAGDTLLGTIISAFLVTATLQGGYLIGAAARMLVRRFGAPSSSADSGAGGVRRLLRGLRCRLARRPPKNPPSERSMRYRQTLTPREGSAG